MTETKAKRPAYKAKWQHAASEAKRWRDHAEAQTEEVARLRGVLARQWSPSMLSLNDRQQVELTEFPYECYAATLTTMTRFVADGIEDAPRGHQTLRWKQYPVVRIGE